MRYERSSRHGPIGSPLLSRLYFVMVGLILAANRVANIAGASGHYRSTWSPSSPRPLNLAPTSFDVGPVDGRVVLQGRVEDVAPEISADAYFLDPPYMKRQYAANYHILETLTAPRINPTQSGSVVFGIGGGWDLQL